MFILKLPMALAIFLAAILMVVISLPLYLGDRLCTYIVAVLLDRFGGGPD